MNDNATKNKENFFFQFDYLTFCICICFCFLFEFYDVPTLPNASFSLLPAFVQHFHMTPLQRIASQAKTTKLLTTNFGIVQINRAKNFLSRIICIVWMIQNDFNFTDFFIDWRRFRLICRRFHCLSCF